MDTREEKLRRIEELRRKIQEKNNNPSELDSFISNLKTGISQIPKNPIGALAHVGLAGLQTVSSPFTVADYAVRQIPYIGEPTANAIALPFQAIGEGVKLGERAIDVGLKSVGIEFPNNPVAEQTLSQLNQGLAQFMVGGKVASLFPRTPTPLKPNPRYGASEGAYEEIPKPFTAKELSGDLPPLEIKTTPNIEKLAQPVRDKLIQSGENKEFVNKLSLTELQKLSEQKELTIPPPIGELAPITKAGEPITPPLINDVAGNTSVKQPSFTWGMFGKDVLSKITNLVKKEKAELPKNPEQDSRIAMVSNLIREAKPLREETQNLYHQERMKRVAKLADVQKTQSGESSLYKSLATQMGELPKATYEPLRNKITQIDIDYFHDTVLRSNLSPYEKLGAQRALDKIFTRKGTEIPTKSEISLLEDVFGSEFAKSISDKMSTWSKIKSELVDAANVPRTLMAAFDMSMPFRQAVVQTVRHPIKSAGWFKDMHKAFISEKSFMDIKNEINSRPNSTLYKEFRLDILDPDKQLGSLTRREESFTSHLAERIPIVGRGVRMSERAAYTYLNKVRADVFDMYSSELQKGGFTPAKNPEYYRALSNWLNYSTGRGSYGSFTQYAPTASALMFSPRLLASRFQLLNPITYVKMPKAVRVMAMKDMFSFVGSMTALLTLAKAGGANIETDPRSSDFGKMKFGNTRIDPWGGFQQLVRFGAQLTSGQKKTQRGQITNLDNKTPVSGNRMDLIYRFGESKLNPHVGFLVEWLKAKNFQGEKFELDNEAIQHLAPLYLQDAYDAIKKEGIGKGALITFPGFYGMGTSTYELKPLKFNLP